MRITNQLTQQSALSAIRARLEAFDRAQAEVADGKKVRTLSDAPRIAADILRLGSKIRDNDQFRRNGVFASTRLGAEEVVLDSIHDMVQEAKGLANAGATSDPADPTRQAALATVQSFLDQVIGLGNTKVGTEFIFGGGETGAAPFKPNGFYAGDTTVRRVEIDDGVFLDANHTGDQIISKVVQALQDLVTELQSGTASSIQASWGALDAVDQVVLAGQGAVGVRQSQVQDTAQRLGSRNASLMDQIQALRDADPAESAAKLLAAQTALEQAYAAIGRVLQNSLLNYLP